MNKPVVVMVNQIREALFFIKRDIPDKMAIQ